ncbi:MAG: aminotransferase class III-fold pyridoxal phosphate-dependent enzyme [Microthrixaceae bacterium]
MSNLFGTEHELARSHRPSTELLGGGGQVFFCNSGAEAERMQRSSSLGSSVGGGVTWWSAPTAASTAGRSPTLHAHRPAPAKHEAFQPLPEGFRHVAWDDLDQLEAAIDDTVAAVLLEPVQGEGGVNPASIEYFAGVRRICDERGVLFMVDEVQTGLGRTRRAGSHTSTSGSCPMS